MQIESLLRVVTGRLGPLVAKLMWVGQKVVAPLRVDEGPNKFRLSSVNTATTTYEGDTGWAKRPPATVACARCGSEIFQHNAQDEIDCPRCVAVYDAEAFGDLELLSMTCPVCRSPMASGRRHPDQFDIPQWATCERCRYHWEFEHSYDE